jgi:hypothetical protein
MAEFGVGNMRTLESFKGVMKKKEGSKPLLFFAGEVWDQDIKWARIKNLLIGRCACPQTLLPPSTDLFGPSSLCSIGLCPGSVCASLFPHCPPASLVSVPVLRCCADVFRGDDVSRVSLAGLDCVASFTLVGKSVLVRNYSIQLRRSGSKVRDATRSQRQ